MSVTATTADDVTLPPAPPSSPVKDMKTPQDQMLCAPEQPPAVRKRRIHPVYEAVEYALFIERRGDDLIYIDCRTGETTKMSLL